ncbi:protein DpdF [Pseudonocardia adelaidensis]|uniref:DNA 3'-5' helicase n=1 Tax=Pseudonocardia adelaidensis TaxID=648754 RepID=A0ABP9NTL2_9PSEU
MDEEARLLRFLEHPDGRPVFEDDLFARLANVVGAGAGSDLDLAVLLRQLLRRRSLEDGNTAWLRTAPGISGRLRAAPMAGLRETQPDMWSAPVWEPGWLQDTSGVPDQAAVAGGSAGQRFFPDELKADPFFEKCTTFPRYRTPGQRAACRAVVSVPDGSTVIGMLPTGSGKTEVALCLQERVDGLTVVVVPTIALAYDFERRFRDHFARRNPRVKKGQLHFAWSASTPKETRELIEERVRHGKQHLLVTSPESVSRALRDLLREAASTGRLGALVVDEAHLVTQWGREFRPEFRTLADFRNDLLHAAEKAGCPPLTTLLLSATLGSGELQDLHDLFADPGPCALIAANALRAEPDFWVAAAEDDAQRKGWVLEALAHLPRPAILYVTSPKTADGWAERLRDHGYDRLAVVTGETADADRKAVLEGLRNTPEQAARFDLVVATSAFGLGIDYPHIRSVVHACLPETVDRWYQELGRGGRDGHVAAAFLLTAPGDRKEAASLGVTVLTADTAWKRWRDLWAHRGTLEGRHFIDIQRSHGGVREGSYNRKWNAQLIQGLVELEAVGRLPVDVEDVEELTPATANSGQHEWVGVELLRNNVSTDDSFWQEKWTPWQRAETQRSQRALDAISGVASGKIPVCEAIAQAYRPDDTIHNLFGRAARYAEPEGQCGRCPSCRQKGIPATNDPPPHPVQAWALPADQAPELGRLIEASGRQDGLVILVADEPAEVSHRLAKALISRGIRHVAGPVGDNNELLENAHWLFVDLDPVSPSMVTPHSAFVVYPEGVPVPSRWLSTGQRRQNRNDTPPAVDVLLLARRARLGRHDLERDLRALDALTALQILGDR